MFSLRYTGSWNCPIDELNGQQFRSQGSLLGVPWNERGRVGWSRGKRLKGQQYNSKHGGDPALWELRLLWALFLFMLGVNCKYKVSLSKL